MIPVSGIRRVTPPTMMNVWRATALVRPAPSILLKPSSLARAARNPRPIVGFSDLTALHQAVAVKAGVASFHGPMVNLDFHDGLSPDIEQWLWSMLAGG